jgi:hypothetical protein
MIHFKREGGHLHSGLNITLSKWWVGFYYVSVDFQYTECITYYLRIRLLPIGPKIFYGKNTWDFVNTFLSRGNRDLYLITREQHEDLLNNTNCRYIPFKRIN